MNLFPQITETEKVMITNYINDFSGDVLSYSLEYLLRFWDENKAKLSELFGGNLIISKEDFEYQMDNDELEDNMHQALKNPNMYNFIQEYLEKIRELGRTYVINRDAYWALRGFIEPYILVKNKALCPNFSIPSPSGQDIKITSGGKVTKILKKFAEAYDIAGYEEFRLAHSLVLNQKKVKGRLTLSIHPLDFMTMSDNDNGWDSCMSWMEEGSYRQGTVEMMNSPVVVVAYIESKNPMDLRGGEWNNKKWRELYIVTPDIITNIKSYPYKNDSISQYVLSWLKELAEKAWDTSYEETMIQYDKEERVFVNGKYVTFYPRTHCMYNDFYAGHYAYFNKNVRDGALDVLYSGESECMRCGSEIFDYDREGDLVGKCCSEKFFCEWCNAEYSSDEDFETVDGVYICPCCVDGECAEDFVTGALHLKENMRQLYIIDEHEDIFALTSLMYFESDLGDYEESFKPFFNHLYTCKNKLIAKSSDIKKNADLETDFLWYQMNDWYYRLNNLVRTARFGTEKIELEQIF